MMSNSSDQCALNADGTLKPTAEIDFYFDEDNNVPMAGPTVATKGQSTCSSLSVCLYVLNICIRPNTQVEHWWTSDGAFGC